MSCTTWKRNEVLYAIEFFYMVTKQLVHPEKNVNKLKLDHQPWVCVKLGNGFEWKLCRAPTQWPTNHINGHYWPTARKLSQAFIFNPGHYVLEQNMFLMSGFSSFWRLFCNQPFLTEKELLREVRNKLHLLYFTNNPTAKNLHFMYWKYSNICTKADILIQAWGYHFPFSIVIDEKTSWTLLLPQTYPQTRKMTRRKLSLSRNGFAWLSRCHQLLWQAVTNSWLQIMADEG